jgi:predicted transglutaminase-like cysteine proteinase
MQSIMAKRFLFFQGGVLLSLFAFWQPVALSAASDTMIASSWQERRIQAWNSLISQYRNNTEVLKISKANEFINQLQYVDDQQQWGREDYWSTPLEFVRDNGGDCEDYAIAKYFTLLDMGVPEAKLRLAYVYSTRLKQSHMVLYYYPQAGAVPLVLDNLESSIAKASLRKDLLPVYSFNRNSLWLVSKTGQSRHVGPATRLSRWQAVLSRMARG